MKFTRSLLFITLISLIEVSQAQISYTADDGLIANPSRGFYHHTEVHSGDYSLLNKETLTGYRENEQITQILRVFYLASFKEGPISQDFLNKMRMDFATVRSAGIKCIVRFAYTTKSTAPYGDATPQVVQTHINQLTPVLRENADVIAVVQTGFVGAWGEWYYTDYFANKPGTVTDQNWADRKDVVIGLLDALPVDRMVQLRTPGYKMKIFGSTDPLNETTAFSGSYASRVGHHNDCFVASESDYGTYVNPSLEKPYLEADTRFTPMGGETCNLADPYSDCDNSLSELERFHWSFLNIDYNKEVLGHWEDQGCFNEVELSLGYRYQLSDGNYTTSTKPGGTINFDLKMINVGYTNPYNPRLLEVILKNQQTGEEYFIEPNETIKLWPIKEYFNITFQAGIPADMPEGDYDLLLNLPDPYPSLYDNPDYGIRMANTDTWIDSLGYNDLKQSISIKASNTATDYMGSDYFEIKTTSNTLNLDGADQIFGGAGSENLLVYWGRQSQDYNRVIERSTDGTNFKTIASIPGEQDYYLDTDVSANQTYTYRYYLQQGRNRTNASNSISLQMNNVEFPEINIDGSESDWLDIPPTATALNGTSVNSIRVLFNAQTMNVAIMGSTASYEIFINTDNKSTTGDQSAGISNGMDYKITQDGLYSYGTDWTLTSASITSASDASLELSILQSDLAGLDTNQVIPIYAVLEGGILLSNTESKPSIAYRELPPDVPADLAVRNSGELPKSRLVITWTACNNCLGYKLEKSLDNQSFELLGDYPTTTTLIRDDNLTNETTYYYRIASYNQIGMSTYSEVESGTTGIVIINGIPKDLKIFPNPTSGLINLSKTYDQVEVYSLSGRLLKAKAQSNSIDISNIQQGIYLMRLTSGTTSYQVKVIRQ